jgi:hypothetical protein
MLRMHSTSSSQNISLTNSSSHAPLIGFIKAFGFGVREGKEMRSGPVGTTGRERRKEEVAEPI